MFTFLINNGSPNRSGIATIQCQFDVPTAIKSVESLLLINRSTGAIIDASGATLEGNGTAIVTWNVLALNLPEGVYLAVLPADQTTPPISRDEASTFHRLMGDVNGDRVVNNDDYLAVKAVFGSKPGPYGPGDTNGNGVVSFSDYTAVQANLGKSLSTP